MFSYFMQTWFLFFLLSLLNIIPIIGTIAWLVIYLIIGFSAETAPSLRKYIKLQIIVSVAVLLFCGILCAFAYGVFAALSQQEVRCEHE